MLCPFWKSNCTDSLEAVAAGVDEEPIEECPLYDSGTRQCSLKALREAAKKILAADEIHIG